MTLVLKKSTSICSPEYARTRWHGESCWHVLLACSSRSPPATLVGARLVLRDSVVQGPFCSRASRVLGGRYQQFPSVPIVLKRPSWICKDNVQPAIQHPGQLGPRSSSVVSHLADSIKESPTTCSWISRPDDSRAQKVYINLFT